MEGKVRCCQNCKAPCAGDFKKVVDLQYSGLVIYVHTKKDEQKKAGASKYGDTFILHNTGSKQIQRPEYITELHRFKTKCGQCKNIVQRVRSLLDEIRAIRENEVIGICEHCKRATLSKRTCKRCDFIVRKFISIHQKSREEKQERFKVWLCKVKHLLQAILDGESVCQHRVYKDTELERILHELKEPLYMREPDIDFFPSLDKEQLTSLQSLSESKEMFEKLLTKMNFKGENRFSSDESLSASKEMCLCKFLKEGHYEEEISGLTSVKSKGSDDTILSGEPITDFSRFLSQDMYNSLIRRLSDLNKALPQGLYLNKELMQRIIKTLNTAINQGLSTNNIVKLINELKDLNKTLTHDLSKDLNKEVIQGLINDLSELLTIGSYKNLNKDLIRLLINLSDLVTHELSKGLFKEHSHLLPKITQKDLDQTLSVSTYKDVIHVVSKRIREEPQGTPASLSREILQGSLESPSKEIQDSMEGFFKRQSKEGIQDLPKSQSKDGTQGLLRGQSKKSIQAFPKSQSKDNAHGEHKGQSKDGLQDISKDQTKNGEQALSRGLSKKSMQGFIPKTQSKDGPSSVPRVRSKDGMESLTKEETQGLHKGESKEHDSPKSTRKEIMQDVPKGVHKEISQLPKSQIKHATSSSFKALLKESVQGLPKKDLTPEKSKDITKVHKYIKPESPTVKIKGISETTSIDTTNPLVQKLVDLNRALAERALDKNLIRDLTSDINNVLGQRSSDLLNKIIQELTHLCKPVVQGIPKSSNLKLVQDLINDASKALDQGLSKDQNKKTVQGLLNNLNKMLTPGTKFDHQLTKGIQKGITKIIGKHLSSTKGLISRTRDMSKRRLKDLGKQRYSSEDYAIKGKKSMKPKQGDIIDKFVSSSEEDIYEKEVKRSPSKKKSSKGRTESASEEDIKKEIKSKTTSKKTFVTDRTSKKTNKKIPSIDRMSQKTRLELASRRRRTKFSFENVSDISYDIETKYEKSAPTKKDKTSKEVKIKEKGNLQPKHENKSKELTSKSKQKLSAQQLRKAKQLSESILIRLLNDNRINAEKYKLYKQKMLAREKEMERRRLKELTMKYLPPPKKKIIITPPSTPEDTSDSTILECEIQQISLPNLMVRGEEITPFIHHHKKYKDIEDQKDHEPMFFKTQFQFGDDAVVRRKSRYQPGVDYEAMFRDGIVRYRLSNREFIDKGWTMLPTKKIMRRMNIYKMEPVNPQNDWFERHKQDRELFYDSGHKLADIDLDSRGHWYYRSGTIALDYYNAQESNIGQRYVVYSSGTEMDCGQIKPRTILALFDGLGNGVVYDHYGNVRLKYNQSEGMIVDPKLGPPGKWKWHTLNDPPVLQQVFVNTCLKKRDPKLDLVPKPEKGQDATELVKEAHPEMLAIELDNFVKQKTSKLMRKFKPFQIRMKAVKLNEQFSLKIMDQASIYLIFRDRLTSLKLNLGMTLISDEIIDTDTSDMADVSTPYDRRPAKTHSVENIQKILKTVRSGKLRPPSEHTARDSIRFS